MMLLLVDVLDEDLDVVVQLDVVVRLDVDTGLMRCRFVWLDEEDLLAHGTEIEVDGVGLE